MLGTISDAVNQMAKFSYEQEAREAKQRGIQRVADEGAQPVLATMRQAGGQPAVIGGIVGFTKAILSLIVVMMLVADKV